MLRLSTKGRYGTRLMLNLAQRYRGGDGAVILKEISDQEEISIRYLEQIIIPLKLGKLVKSTRGAGGGYTLARSPAEITLCEILEALEGTCCLVECVEDPDFCNRVQVCPTYEVWAGATRVLKDYFDGITLQDLIKQAEKKQRRNVLRPKNN